MWDRTGSTILKRLQSADSGVVEEVIEGSVVGGIVVAELLAVAESVVAGELVVLVAVAESVVVGELVVLVAVVVVVDEGIAESSGTDHMQSGLPGLDLHCCRGWSPPKIRYATFEEDQLALPCSSRLHQWYLAATVKVVSDNSRFLKSGRGTAWENQLYCPHD